MIWHKYSSYRFGLHIGRHRCEKTCRPIFTWWRHQMETFSALLAICKGQWRGALMFSLTCACMDGWVNNRHAGDLRRHRVHYDVTVMNCRSISRYMCYITVNAIRLVPTWCKDICNHFDDVNRSVLPGRFQPKDGVLATSARVIPDI